MARVPVSPLELSHQTAQLASAPRPMPILVRPRGEATHEFASERDERAPLDARQARGVDASDQPTRRRRRQSVSSAAATAVSLGIALVATIGLTRSEGAGSARVSVDTNPPGASVRVSGVDRGTTPIELDQPIGRTTLVVQSNHAQRTIDLTLHPGESVHHYLELAAPPVQPATGTLEGASDSPNVAHRSGTARSAGWLNVLSPVAFRILENGQVLGTSAVDRVILPTGTHRLLFVSEETGFEVSRDVDVMAGQASMVSIAIPTSTLSVEATPWADVFVDGAPVGKTPLANLELPLGRHEVVLRHPELGERRRVATVSVRGPAAVSVDFEGEPSGR